LVAWPIFSLDPIIIGLLNGVALSIMIGQVGKVLGSTPEATRFFKQLMEIPHLVVTAPLADGRPVDLLRGGDVLPAALHKTRAGVAGDHDPCRAGRISVRTRQFRGGADRTGGPPACLIW
jgi:hypothetical protein